MNAKRLRATVSCASIGLLWGAILPAVAAEPCYQVSLKDRPAWVSSATFLEDSAQLLVVDPFQNRIFSYSPESGEAHRLSDIELKSGSPFYPTAVARLSSGNFLLELSDGETVLLNKELRLLEEQLTAPSKDAKDLRLGSLYQWKVLGDSIIAYGSLIKGRGDTLEVNFAFFRLPIKDPSSVTPEVLKLSGDSSYFLLGYSYIAVARGAAYFVSMDEDHPSIYRVLLKGRGIEKLTAFPEDQDLRSRPRFHTRMTGPKTAPAHFAELATFPVVSGIYEQGGMLYLLVRRPEKKGDAMTTAWYLYKIDPTGKGKVLGSVKLPTSSEHLTIVASAKKWFLIERGPVQERQQQEIANLVVIDSPAISRLSKLPNSCPAK